MDPLLIKYAPTHAEVVARRAAMWPDCNQHLLTQVEFMGATVNAGLPLLCMLHAAGVHGVAEFFEIHRGEKPLLSLWFEPCVTDLRSFRDRLKGLGFTYKRPRSRWERHINTAEDISRPSAVLGLPVYLFN